MNNRITQIEDEGRKQIVEIIDVEKVLAEIIDYDISISEGVLDEEIVNEFAGRNVLIVDDSSTARTQIKGTLEQLGINIIECNDGRQALDLLKKWCDEGKDINEELLLMITDAEMPEMDGYRLTHEVRNDPRMAALVVGLSASNTFVLPTHQVNALIMRPGGYRTVDYAKAGVIMTGIFLAVELTILYFFYGIQ